MKKTYVKTLFFNGIQNKLGKGLLQNLVKEFPNLKTIITVCDGEKIVFEGIEVVNLNYREILYGIYEGIDDLIEVDELDFSRYKDSFFDAYKMLDRLHSLFSLNDRNKINILLSHIKYWENIILFYMVKIV